MSAEDTSALQHTIARLQSILLTCVLRQIPLPGQAHIPRFPDLKFILESPTVLISQDNVIGALELEGVDKPVEIVPNAEIRDTAVRSGDLAFVRFHPAEEINGRIRIRMDVTMAPTKPSIKPLGLGAISVTFIERSDGNWEVAEPPMSVAL